MTSSDLFRPKIDITVQRNQRLMKTIQTNDPPEEDDQAEENENQEVVDKNQKEVDENQEEVDENQEDKKEDQNKNKKGVSVISSEYDSISSE
ncbi:unnamed protein product [Rhizophagus irregularis]|nr:unnamed protein product [Rhizophagus irregularis]CAB5393934.1 unnamed protein product [Rhizophagus irregularis]